MPYSPVVAVILTVLFSVTGIGYLVRAIRDGGGAIGRTSDILHIVMSIAMLAMPWAWGMTFLPPPLQMFLFGLATLFFVGLLFVGPSAGEATDHHSGCASLVYHVVMMGSMIVMAVMMSGMSSGSAMSMPGMDMGSGSGMDMSGSSAWTSVVSVIFVVIFAVGAIWQLIRLFRPAHVHVGARTNAALLLAMSAGMAVAFVQS